LALQILRHGDGRDKAAENQGKRQHQTVHGRAFTEGWKWGAPICGTPRACQ